MCVVTRVQLCVCLCVSCMCSCAACMCARARSCTCERRSASRAHRQAPFSGTATTSRFEVRQIYAGLLNAREAPTPVCGFHGGRGASDDFGPANQTIPLLIMSHLPHLSIPRFATDVPRRRFISPPPPRLYSYVTFANGMRAHEADRDDTFI